MICGSHGIFFDAQFITSLLFALSSQDKELRKLMHQQIPDDPQLDPPIPFDLGTLSFAGTYACAMQENDVQ